MIEKLWAPIEGFPEYAISNHGEICNLKYDRILVPRFNSYGYQKVSLRRDKVTHEKLVHQIVAKAFMSGFTDGTRIRHADGDNTNNVVTNLRFRSRSGVGQYKKDQPKQYSRKLIIRETGQVFRTAYHCANFLGGDPSSIYKVLNGHRRSYMGYTFEYFEEEL